MCQFEFLSHVREIFVHGDHSLNTSDHHPITVCLCVDISRSDVKTRTLFRWDKANKPLYEYELDLALCDSKVTDIAISNARDVDYVCDTLIAAMVTVSNDVVPKSAFCSYKKPYWNSELKSLHQKQKVLRQVWVNEGRPRGDKYTSYVNYKQAKRVFAKTLKQCASAYEQTQYHDVSLSHDMNINKFWKYVRGNKARVDTCNTICDDGIVYDNPEAQLQMWRAHYCNILNESTNESLDYDNEFKHTVETEVENLGYVMDKGDSPAGINLTPFTVDEITIICNRLPNGKAPGFDCLSYEHLKYAGIIFKTLLTRLFNGIMKYVHIPPQFKEGLLITLYKGHGKPKSEKNSYRGITLLPAINKVFEKCIHSRMKPFLTETCFPPTLQHSGRSGVNNVMLSNLTQDSIYNYTEKGGKVFACFLDIEKAFDKLWWDGFFLKLYKIGITNKLWHLFRDWFVGSSCRVCINGEISEPFNITRSIKQGGILSMLNFCIYTHDIHNDIDMQRKHGLFCNNVYVGSPAYADDIVLLSPTKHGLDRMIANAWSYSRKWRFTFSHSKSKCMVFGEGKLTNRRNMQSRKFYMGNHILDEVTHYTHVGIKLCSYDNSHERTEEMCSKGTRLLASLSSIGVKRNGLYPHVSSFLWSSICIPSMLHGCELWYCLSKGEIDLLETTQCRALRKVQHLPRRTHNCVTRGLLGQLSIVSQLNTKKLLFLERMVSLSSSCIVKLVFLSRLYDCMHNDGMKGYILDIKHVLYMYELQNYLLCYMQGSRFPDKSEWKQIVKRAVVQRDYELAVEELIAKNDCTRYISMMNIDNHTSLHPFYGIIRTCTNMGFNKALLTAIKLLSLPNITYDSHECKLCNQPCNDISNHLIAECPLLYEERNILWDCILDTLDVRTSVKLSSVDDSQFTDILFGKKWNGFSRLSCIDDLYCKIAIIMSKHFICGYQINYPWFREYE
jgi:hypothetical protein